MAGEPIEFGHHDTDDLCSLGHLNVCESFDREAVRHFIQHTLEVVHSIGIGNESMPGLPFGEFFLGPMVKSDIRHDVDNFLTRELRHEPQHAMRTCMGRAEIDEHIVEIRVLMGAG